ncbi:MAG: hypothetical protein ACREMB_28460, partial [Candidatus Rokuibacteriota bacterium]
PLGRVTAGPLRGVGAGFLVVALLWAAGPPAARAEDRVARYSGRVERVDLGDGVVVVDELGARGHRVRHEIHVDADTAIVTTARLRPWQMRGARAYEEVTVSLADVLSGDFVIVESTEAHGRILALRITIVEDPRRSLR